jgi:hypothetical protein
MSRKIIHLTVGYKTTPETELRKVAINVDAIRFLEECAPTSKARWGETIVVYGSDSGEETSSFTAWESYETVLRMWADALASED